jgi:hypothetical protein
MHSGAGFGGEIAQFRDGIGRTEALTALQIQNSAQNRLSAFQVIEIEIDVDLLSVVGRGHGVDGVGEITRAGEKWRERRRDSKWITLR